MFLMFCAFIIVSVFEIKHLYKTKNKKEGFIYIIIASLTIALAVFLMLVPDFRSLTKIILDLGGVKQ
jgi:hypothetical protein